MTTKVRIALCVVGPILGFAAILGIAANECFPTISIEGAVTDTSGVPIVAARITTRMGHAYATDSRGCFSLRERVWPLYSGLPGGIKVEKEGYKMDVFGFPADTKKVSIILASSTSSERTTERVGVDLPTCR